MAGFSLGEYAALTAAGVISGIADGVELMEHRGRYMGEAGRNEAGENIEPWPLPSEILRKSGNA